MPIDFPENTLISNTKKNFTKDEIPVFVKWLKDKGYLKTDCWCKRIQEYKDKDK